MSVVHRRSCWTTGAFIKLMGMFNQSIPNWFYDNMMHHLDFKMCQKSLILAVLVSCEAFNILVVFPLPVTSHSILGEGYVMNLLESGHQVTYLTPFPIKNTTKNVANLRQIDVSENIEHFIMDVFTTHTLENHEIDLQNYMLMQSLFRDLFYNSFETEVVQNFLNASQETFDAVIVDWLYSELGAGFAAVFNCPLVWASSMDPHTSVLSLIDDYLNPTYTIEHLSKEYSFTFAERMNQLWSLSKILFAKWMRRDGDNEDFKKLYGKAITSRGGPLPHFEDVKYNASLMLGNSHITTGDSISLPQNYKHVGGYHISNKINSLPKDLQDIMDKANNGVIYFSLGSVLRGTNLPVVLKKELLDMFSELNQTVIWKLEKITNNNDIPRNVHVISWAPQQSILAHPNCKLFITHGGLLSTIETLNFGVPIIGIPFFGDQYINVNRAVDKGFGKRVNFDDNVTLSLKSAINEMFQKPRYFQRAKELSFIFHDRIVPPGKELVFWIEHVIKTNGAPLLTSVALHFSWYKKIYLDLIFLVIIFIVLFAYVFKSFMNCSNINLGSKFKKS